MCFRYKTNIGTHCICNSTISIPAACFGHSITIIRQYDTPSYLKHVTIWYSYNSNVHLYHTDILSYVCAMSHAVKPSACVHLAYCSHLLHWQLQHAIYGSKLIVDSCVLLWTLKQYSRETHFQLHTHSFTASSITQTLLGYQYDTSVSYHCNCCYRSFRFESWTGPAIRVQTLNSPYWELIILDN